MLYTQFHGRQGIFNLVSDPSGNLSPGGHPLSLFQFGQIIKNHHYAQVTSGIVFE